MTSFIITTLAIAFTAWIVYAATYRAAYMHGQHDANNQWRYELDKVHSDDPSIRYIVNRFNAGPVPRGTCRTRCHPADCDDTCPRYSEPRDV